MHASKLSLLVATAALLIGAGFVGALPAPAQRPMSDAVACDRVEKYTTDWFLENTKPEFRKNLVRNALFYSHGMSTSARRFAKSNGTLVTIWNVWPDYLYNKHNSTDNSLRCIHGDTKQQLHFFENMSRAFAMKARSFATVMHSTPNFKDPPKNGIWARVEFPVLQSGLVDSLEKINENRSMAQIFWKYLQDEYKAMVRPVATKGFGRNLFGIGDGSNRFHRGLVKREVPGSDFYVTERELEMFDNIDW